MCPDDGGVLVEPVTAEARRVGTPRFGLAVPVPPPESLTFDVHFGSDAVMKVARRMAGDAVVETRRFWTRHVVMGR